MVFTKSKRWELIGLTSYGVSGECARNYADVYTRITAFLPFIQTITKGTSSTKSRVKCLCQCPHGSNQESAYTTEHSAEACVDACQAVSPNTCNPENTYACLEAKCAYSKHYSFDDDDLNNTVIFYPNGNRYERRYSKISRDHILPCRVIHLSVIDTMTE
jgi:secreted trypsin-like serine protease